MNRPALALGLALALRALALPAHAQLATPGLPADAAPALASAPAPEGPPEEPTPTELAATTRAVQDSAGIAARQLTVLADVEAPAATLAEVRARQQELAALLASLRAVENTRPERLLRLRDLTLAQQTRVEQLSERLNERLSTLATLRSNWLGRVGTLTGWEASVPQRPELQPQLPEIRRALQLSRGVLARADSVTPAVAALQREAQVSLDETRDLLEQIAAVRAGRLASLHRADQPVLLAPAHLAQLRDPAAWRPGEAVRAGGIMAFAREHAGLLLLHLFLIVALWRLALWLRPHTAPEGHWSGILLRPWAFGTFAATALLTRRYLLAPPLWDVVNWTLLAASGAVLAALLLRGRGLRLMIVSVAAAYPLLLLGEALQLPAPLFRLGIAAAALAGVVGFPLLGLRARGEPPPRRGKRPVLALTSALFAAVLVAQLLGFDQLSRWLVHATLTSAYVLLSASFLIVTGRGALATLLRKEFVGRVRFVGTVAVPLAERLMALLQLAIVVGAGLVLLDVWELAPSPVESWRAFVGAGFMLAGIHITVGRILAAVVLVYLALTVSWLARTLVNEEASRGWHMERGVADSIGTLVHYAVITLGVLFALGALGVELQNFAIVAGALGVGIGFGLQNVVNNFVSGLILLFERPVRVGDTVEVDGEWGTIKKIGLRSTIVVTFTQAELIVPNGELVAQKVTNWTLTNPVTRLAIPVGVAYGSDVKRVMEILCEAGSVHPAVSANPAPNALFIGFGDSSLDFELRIWVTDIASRLIARSAVLTEIDRRFREEKIEIPFPQRDLHVRSVDAGAAALVRGPAPESGGG
jgi:potassium-dependent mechanosensitive channel